MPLLIVRNDVTRMEVDAIVNSADPDAIVGGGVDGAIHRAAGPELIAARRKIGPLKAGEAGITGAFRLPARFVIHAVGPVWRDGNHGEEAALRSAYRRSLGLALENGCQSVAFPLISAGVFGYPRAQALNVAVSEIGAFVACHDVLVYIVVYDRNSFAISEQMFSAVKAYIDENYVGTRAEDGAYTSESIHRRSGQSDYDQEPRAESRTELRNRIDAASGVSQSIVPPFAKRDFKLDETFSEKLLRLIREKQRDASDVYLRANVNKQLFSKIKNDRFHHPKKTTAFAFALSLRLTREETLDLIGSAGYTITHASMLDIIVEYAITHGNYDVFEVNDVLYDFDQPLLGF